MISSFKGEFFAMDIINKSNSMKILKNFSFIPLMFFYVAVTQAELRIEVKKSGEKGAGVPIAVVPFGSQNVTVPVDVSAIVNSDLALSGYFKTLAEEQMLTKPTTAAEVQFRAWQILGQEYLVVGKVEKNNANYSILFQLLSISQKSQLIDYRISTGEQGLRRAAHKISDLIYEKLTGKKGVFDTRVAFISNESGVYKLQVADMDGFEAKTIVSTSEPIMSPAWSPDGAKIAYVSFESHRPVIFVQTLATGTRSQVSAFSGINGAPAWSPDGTKLAITLSKGGNPNIYIANLASNAVTQLTNLSGINTEPTWSPDGQTIVFTSNQDGKPQLYKIPSNGGNAQRLTFEGEYNAKASFSPDGQKIAMVHGNGGSYKIALLELNTGAINVLTSGSLDESPSFSSNGAMVLYATQKGDKSVLAAVSIDGKIQQQLNFQNTRVRDPSWAP
jgi:TolB protein